MSADVSISANSQPTRAVESDHLVASCTQRRDECLLDVTHFLTDRFSVNKSSEQCECIFMSAFLLEQMRQVNKYPLRSCCLVWNVPRQKAIEESQSLTEELRGMLLRGPMAG